jgi:hypothetical protein
VEMGIKTLLQSVEFSSITHTTSKTLFHILIFCHTGFSQAKSSVETSFQITATLSKSSIFFCVIFEPYSIETFLTLK